MTYKEFCNEIFAYNVDDLFDDNFNVSENFLSFFNLEKEKISESFIQNVDFIIKYKKGITCLIIFSSNTNEKIVNDNHTGFCEKKKASLIENVTFAKMEYRFSNWSNYFDYALKEINNYGKTYYNHNCSNCGINVFYFNDANNHKPCVCFAAYDLNNLTKKLYEKSYYLNLNKKAQKELLRIKLFKKMKIFYVLGIISLLAFLIIFFS